MTEEIATYQAGESAVAKKPDYWNSIPINPETLIPEPRNLAEMWFCARFFASTGMVPQQFSEVREIPGKNGAVIYDEIGAKRLMCAWMMGRQTGMQLWSAMKSIAVINNRASIFGAGAIGLVRAKGKLSWLKEGLTGEETTRTAWCEVKRSGEPPDVTYKKAFSWAQAKTAGLLDDAKKKHTWGKYLDDMLLSKARARALSVAFADILEGLSIAEDVADYEEDVIKSGGKQAPPSAFDFMAAAPEPVAVKSTKPEEPEPEKAPEKAQERDKLDHMLDKTHLTGEQRDLIGSFIDEVAASSSVDVPDIRFSAASQFKSFLVQFGKWLGRQGIAFDIEKATSGGKAPAPEEAKKAPEPEPKEVSPNNWWLARENWINSRGKGFKNRINENLMDLTEMPDAFVYEEIYKKWMGSKDVEKMGQFPLMPKVVRHCLANKIDIAATVGTEEPPEVTQEPPPPGENDEPAEPIREPDEPQHDFIPQDLELINERIEEEREWDPERFTLACKSLGIKHKGVQILVDDVQLGQELLAAIRDSYEADKF